MRMTIVLTILLMALKILSSANVDFPLKTEYEEYFYKSIDKKMSESLSTGHCSYKTNTQDQSADLTILEYQPPSFVTNIWGTLNNESIAKPLYFATTSALCKSKYFQKIKTGSYRESKGCAQYDRYDENGNFMKTSKRLGSTLHPDHPRCDHRAAATACTKGSLQPTLVREKDRRLHNYPFVVTAQNVIVSRSGMIAQPCGVFGLLAQCEGFVWGVTTVRKVMSDVDDCRPDTIDRCPYKVYDKVFILTQYDDTQIGQFILETLPKLIFHLDYLRAHPEIKIHYGFSKLPVLPAYVLPNGYLDWLGLSDRLINGTVYAKEIMMPREGGCQEPSYNSWELVHQREYFLHLARQEVGLAESSISVQPIPSIMDSETAVRAFTSVEKRTILVIKRTAGRFSQNLSDRNVRMWPKGVLEKLIAELTIKFPLHSVVEFSDSNHTLMSCPLCQVRLFATADVVIGIHGAGLTNTLYMRRGSIVVEVIPKYFDSRHAPAIGVFPRLAAMVGLHHYLYFIPDFEYNVRKIADDVKRFAKATVLWRF